MPRTSNFVPAIRERSQVAPMPQQPPDSYVMQVPQQATQHVEMRTSHVDRATGFLIGNVPMMAIAAITAPIFYSWLSVAPIGFGFGFTLWLLAFAGLWFLSWVVSLAMSAEGNTLIGTLLGWWFLFREQDRRWSQYERMNNYDD